MTTPRPDQIRRQSRLIGELGSRVATNPDVLLELVDTIAGLIGAGGDPGPRPKGHISDPTGATATNPDNEISRDLKAAYRAIDQAAAAMSTLAGLWNTYMPTRAEAVRRSKAIASLDETPACRAHQRAGTWATAGGRYADLCRWCGDFRANHGADPAPELVRWYDSGQRVTQQVIARFMPQVSQTG